MLFGIFRFILAILVVLGHIAPKIGNYSGTYAVFGFYIMSGYLMTFILNKNYGFEISGIRSYISNRFLRIFPTYWLVLIGSMVIIAMIPSVSQQLNPNLAFPNSIGAWLQNIFIIGMGSTFSLSQLDTRIVPPAWALHVELIFYLIIPFFAKNEKRTLYWFIASLLITYFLVVQKQSFDFRYFTLWGASLPFSFGSLIYYISRNKKSLELINNNYLVVLASTIVFFFLNLYFGNVALFQISMLSFYLNMFISGMLILLLANPPKLPTQLKNLDRLLGNISYPIYLIHWIVASIIITLVFNSEVPDRSSSLRIPLFLLTVFISVIISIAINKIFESRIESFRDKIRGFKVN